MASRSNLAKIHIAAKELGLTEDAYRDTLRRITGKDSAHRITDHQAVKVLNHFQSQGWKPRGRRCSSPGFSIPADPQCRKIQALWITLHKAGVIKDGSDKALLSFVKRLTRRDRLEWCNGQDKFKVIEALKDWAARTGVQA
jgi:phage gp16-like protein